QSYFCRGRDHRLDSHADMSLLNRSTFSIAITSFVVLAAAAPCVAGQAAPFKIVVIAGEASVNVIQQKTAVAPLVEVRDRNNNPVSGAVVTFAVQGGKAAAFQGVASTITG